MYSNTRRLFMQGLGHLTGVFSCLCRQYAYTPSNKYIQPAVLDNDYNDNDDNDVTIMMMTIVIQMVLIL